MTFGNEKALLFAKLLQLKLVYEFNLILAYHTLSV